MTADAKPAHSPTPWRWDYYDDGERAEGLACGIDSSSGDVVMEYAGCGSHRMKIAPADADFIVRAVNAHDALVEALRECLGYVESDYETRQGDYGGAQDTVDRARAALKKAETP